ncbi:MAG: hypothetical protein FWC28_05925 [Proteobacteria bacterium]|nr:hypothetical protein [Cystobacterineae bacterium]MCL2314770.1 hypothetical protein [Pseudomonadota bacterium]
MKAELTRWNRAGLKRFRYVDGNAATYLEALRQELIVRLKGWDMELLGLKLDGDTQEERREKLEEKYIKQFGTDHQQALDGYLKLNDNRGSVALEIIRSFARAAHVLTEHLNAYANEGFLGTATQWENVRRLVYGLDYHPKPPASAMTSLVLYAKPGQSGLVSSGLQIKHTPEKSNPIVFETLEDIDVDSALNTLRLKDWNHSPGKVRNEGEGEESSELILDGIVDGLRIGEPVVIENSKGGELQPRLLKNIFVEDECTVLQLNLAIKGIRGDLLVHLKPIEALEIFAPLEEQITQKGTLSLLLEEEPVQLKQSLEAAKDKKDVCYVFIGKDNTGIYRKISEVNDRQIVLAEGETVFQGNLSALGLSESHCFVGVPYVLERLEAENGVYVEGDVTWAQGADVLVRIGKEGTISPCKISAVDLSTRPGRANEPAVVTYLGFAPSLNLDLSAITQIWLPPDVNQWKWKTDSFVDVETMGADKSSLKLSAIKRTARGDLCVIACGQNLMAARVENIPEEEETGRFGLQVNNWQPVATLVEGSKKFIRSQTTVFGKFKEQARLQNWNVNETKLENNTSTLMLEYTEAAEKLKLGQLIVVEQEAPKPRQSFQTRVQDRVKMTDSVTGANSIRLKLASALPDDEYFIGSTVVHANVVLAGHGETQPEKILGSGDATLSNQEFLFPVSNVSFVADETQVISGVRADIRVMVDGEKWIQVARFNQSQPSDPHYVVRMTEEGHLRIVFGDGVNGRRLPSGENNVRIAWRMGSGEEGRLDTGFLKKLAHAHPRVEAVDQPFQSTGGNNMESVITLRRSAPASLLTMERAVSVNDFAALAASHSSVWSARAELESSGSKRMVRVTVVPAGGALDSIPEGLEAYLLLHAIPGVNIKLESYKSEILKLDIFLGIDKTRFDSETIRANVQETLLQRFTLKNRAIGAPVYLSDVYQCIESVHGVEYSVCKFIVVNKEGGVVVDEEGKPELSKEQSRHPEPNGVLYLRKPEDIWWAQGEARK